MSLVLLTGWAGQVTLGQMAVVGVGAVEDLDERPARGALLVQQVGGAVHVVGAEHDVDVGRPLDDARTILLGEAPADDDLEVGVAVFQGLEVAEVAVELVVGVLADTARVEDHHVGVLDVVGSHHALGFEQPRHPFGVVLVHLAPVGAYHVAASGHVVHRPTG